MSATYIHRLVGRGREEGRREETEGGKKRERDMLGLAWAFET